MAQIPFRANLSSALFPLLISKGGRSVIVSGPDQAADNRVESRGTGANSSIIPQLLYGENILPTPEGFQTVGYLPEGLIEIPEGETITAIFCGRVPLTNSIDFGINVTDDMADFTDWTVSADIIGGGRYSAVRLAPAIGAPPIPAFEFREDETRDNGQQPYAYRRVAGLKDSNHIKLTSSIRFSSSDVTQHKKCLIGCGSEFSGSGIKAYFDGELGVMSIASTSSWSSFTFGPGLGGTTLPAMAFDTWYKVVIDMTTNLDSTKTIQVDLYDSLGSTITASMTYTGPFTFGDYIGLAYAETAHDSPIDYASMYWADITAQGTGVGFETIVQTIIVAFFSDNTIAWSHSDVPFENLTGVLAPPTLDLSKASNSFYIPVLLL